MKNKISIDGKDYNASKIVIDMNGIFIDGVRMVHSDDGGLTMDSTQPIKKKRPKLAVNWKEIKKFGLELLKAFLTMYIIHIVADPTNNTESFLASLIGIMWYSLFVKGDYGEKKQI